MTDRKLAPHVARAIGAAQAKPNPALGKPRPAIPAPAAHVRQAVGAVQAKPAAAVQPRVAPHMARALAPPSAATAGRLVQAKPAPALAPHVTAALGTGAAAVLQASKKSKAALDQRKVEVRDIVVKVNDRVEKLTPGRTNYFESKVTSFQDQKIAIRNLPSQNLELSRKQSHFSSLAYVIKHHFDVGPEFQIGLLGDRQNNSKAFVFSSNTGAANRRIEKRTKTRKNLKDYYKQALRHRNSRARAEQLVKDARKLKVTKMRQILTESLRVSNDKASFLKLVNSKIGREVHANTRTDELRLRMKAARRLSYRWTNGSLPIEVTQNTKNIHSESSILTEYPKNKNQQLKMVMGTKVPCISCLAFFRGKNVPDLILDHTSATWLSKSSMEQLGFTTDQIDKYLLHIAKVLNNANIYQHVSRDGEIPVEKLNIDDDPSSDSEDEDAIEDYSYKTLKQPNKGRKTGTKLGIKLHGMIEDFVDDNFY